MEKKWYPGHIDKAKRRIREKIKAVNSVIEMVDARIPYAGRAYEFKDLFSNKHTIILLAKSDLADPVITNEWVEYYRSIGKTAITISVKKSPKSLKKTLNILKNKIPSKSAFKRAMIVGIPNVGKSTLINKLMGKKSMRVGNKPGVTRGLQWINVTPDFLLLDTPGILYSRIFNDEIRYKLILSGSIKGEPDLKDEAIQYLIDYLKKCGKTDILGKLGVKDTQQLLNLPELYQDIARKRGFLLKGGKPDIERSREMILKQFQDGLQGNVSFEKPEDYTRL